MTSDRSDETEVEGKDETDTRTETESDTGETDKPYIRDERYRAKIDDPEDEVRIVQNHYVSAYLDARKPVWPHIATLGGVDAKDDEDNEDAAITQAVVGHQAWWTWRADDLPNLTPDERADGWTSRGRPITWRPDDLEAAIDGMRHDDEHGEWRTIHHLTTWKDPEAVLESKLYNSNAESDKWDGGNPNAGYGDIEGFALWIDGDLSDEWKDRRGELTDDQIETAEAVWEAVIDKFAHLFGLESVDIVAFDSGGGVYVFGPPAATTPIAEHYDRDDRAAIFAELRQRFNDFAERAAERAIESVGGDAAELIDPDVPNNKNRQTKALLAIHKNHDVLVTPLRDENGEIDYTPTLISDAHDADSEPSWPDLINRTIEEAQRMTSTDERILESVDSLIKNLWADEIDEDDAYNDVETWTDVLDTWLEQRAKNREWSDPGALAEAASSGGPGNADRGDALALDETTDDFDDVVASLDSVGAKNGEEIAAKTVVHRWTDQLSDAEDRSGDGKRAFVPRWSTNYSSGNANYLNTKKGVAVNTSKDYHLTIIEMALVGWDDEPWTPGDIAEGTDWFRGYELLREHGYPLPVYKPPQPRPTPSADAAVDGSIAKGDVDPEDVINGQRAYAKHPVLRSEWSRPHPTAEFDRAEHWRLIQDDRLDAAIEATEDGKIPVFSDPAGAGKTANAIIGAWTRGEPFSMLVDKHEKAHELRSEFEAEGNGLPDIEFDLHLKGAEQPIETECMDRQTADAGDRADDGPHCEHEANDEACPRMCPIHGWTIAEKQKELREIRNKDDPDIGDDIRADMIEDMIDKREKYDRIIDGTGSVLTGHRRVGLCETPWHGETCQWMEQFSDIKNAKRVLGVHEYQALKSVRETEQVGERHVFVDEAPRMMGNETELDVVDLGKIKAFLRHIGGPRVNPYQRPYNWHELADFVDRIRDRIEDGTELGDAVDEIEPPTIMWVRSTRDQQSLPGTGTYNIKSRRSPTRGLSADKLADFKVAYNDRVIDEIVNDREWSDVPFGFDQLLAAWKQSLVGSIEDEDSDVELPNNRYGRTKMTIDDIERAFGAAIALPATLDKCPVCDSREVYYDNGRRVCGKWDCEWDEADGIVQDKQLDAPTPMYAWGHDHENLDIGDRGLKTLSNTVLRDVNPIVLDATASPAKIAGVYGRGLDDIEVSTGVEFSEGHDDSEDEAAPDHYNMNTHITQLMSGAYAASTVEGSAGHRRKLQGLIDRVSETHDRPLLISKKNHFLEGVFDVPENAETTHWHGNRGLNKGECDAVIVLSAPRPRIDMTRREARVLSMYRDDLREGGTEYGMRYDHEDEDSRTAEPVYRSLVYEDSDGRGIAVPTGAMSGIAGDLFDEAVSDEIEQGVNRARPLLHPPDEDPVPIWLCTNVPTELPVDVVVDDVADMAPTGRYVFQESYGLGDGPTDLYIELGDALREGDEDALEPLMINHEERHIEANMKALTEFARRRGVESQKGEPNNWTIGNWRDQLADAHLFTEPINCGPHGVVIRAPTPLLTEISRRSQKVVISATSITNSGNHNLSSDRPPSNRSWERSSWEYDISTGEGGEATTDGGERAETDGGRTLDLEATASIKTSASAVDTADDEETSQIDRIEEMGRLMSDALDGDSVDLGDLRGVNCGRLPSAVRKR